MSFIKYKKITGNISPKSNITGEINIPIRVIEPTTSELTVKSNLETQTFTPQEGTYYNKVTVNPILNQSKSIDITENGTTTVTPDQNYDGLSEVTINTSVGGFDWQSIGYDSETVTKLNSYQSDAIEYSKEIYDNWDPTITSRRSAFYDNHKLRYFPNVDFSNVTDAREMFIQNYALEYFPCDISNVSQVQTMFYCCYNLKEVGNCAFTRPTPMSQMFYNCYNLEKVESININASYSSGNIFYNCNSLKTIGAMDTTLVGFTDRIFYECNNLSDETLNIFLGFCKKLVSQNPNYKNLKSFGLSQIQAEKCTTLSNWPELANAGWSTGY